MFVLRELTFCRAVFCRRSVLLSVVRRTTVSSAARSGASSSIKGEARGPKGCDPARQFLQSPGGRALGEGGESLARASAVASRFGKYFCLYGGDLPPPAAPDCAFSRLVAASEPPAGSFCQPDARWKQLPACKLSSGTTHGWQYPKLKARVLGIDGFARARTSHRRGA